MLVKEIMTRHVECVRPDTSIQEAARRMRDLDVGPLPVCGGDDKLAGMVTDRDITVRATAEGRDPTRTTVKEVMTPDVVSCRPDDDVTRAEQLMRLNQVSRILCMDDDGQIAGVISLADISQYEVDTEAGKLLAELKGSEAHVH